MVFCYDGFFSVQDLQTNDLQYSRVYDRIMEMRSIASKMNDTKLRKVAGQEKLVMTR